MVAAACFKVSLACSRDAARRLNDMVDAFAIFDPPPVLLTSEIDAARPDEWRLDIYTETKPPAPMIALARRLISGSPSADQVVEKLGDEDWVTLSQQGMEPIHEGRFYVHTPQHRDHIPEAVTAIEIDAGRAFGTGQHETTSGCLAMIDRLRAAGRRYQSIADIGTGTGLLGFAALSLWPRARVIASDIDAVAIAIARENAAINRVPIGRQRGELELVTAAGLAHRRLKKAAPYDLLIANILAGPLIDLAKPFASATAPGGTIILAGLLQSQADSVADAYRRQRCRLAARIDRGDWTILRLEKRPARAHKPASRAS